MSSLILRRSFAVAALLVAPAACRPATPQTINPAKNDIRFIQVGHRLPVLSATAACGKWLERDRLDPATYGKTRGVAPAISPEPKIVLYTSDLSEDFFKIAQAVDAYVAQHPDLAWSFVQVKDPKGAQNGGYTAGELKVRLAEIRTLAAKHGIKHLSFVVSAPGSHSAVPDTTVVIAHTRLSDRAGASSVVDWFVSQPAATLQGETLTKNLAALDAAAKAPATPKP